MRQCRWDSFKTLCMKWLAEDCWSEWTETVRNILDGSPCQRMN